MIRFMFLRDKKNQPIGCLAIDVSMNIISYGLSVLNPLDKFNRKLARTIALGRLNSPGDTIARSYFNGVSLKTMHDITRAAMQHLISNPHIPTRARKAAKLWLTNNVIGIDTNHATQ